MKKILFLSFLVLCISSSAQKKEKETMVLISTSMGDIKVKLYNETPKHRDNFIKLVNVTFCNGTLFHRVIQNFMIQGGDPKSRNAQPEVMLGEGDVGYTIPAEILPQFFHKKGVLAAARQGDDVNPSRASSGCQFYIVHGKVFTEAELTNIEARINMQNKQKIFGEIINKPEYASIKNRFIANQQAQNQDSLAALGMQIEPIIQKELEARGVYKFTAEQKAAYTTVGGAPHLDGSYTVYGEVVEGLDVVDKIAAVEKNQFDRPKQDIKMTMKIIKK
jgi:peptidylprolyl isomerase